MENISTEYGRFLASPPNGEEVVISGMSGIYPESHNIRELEENLFNKVDLVTDDPRRWEHTHPEIPKRAGKLPEINKFDAGFFGISHRRSTTSDPLKKKVLEVVVEAIFDAGLNVSDFEGTKTGVYSGICFMEATNYWTFLNPIPNHDITLGTLKSLVTDEVSYFLKTSGPTISMDTACSSSLYAVEHAYKAIRNGECDAAVVIGATIHLQPCLSLQFARLGVLSENGLSRSFDADGQGYVRAEAVTAMVLQKSKDAKRIYGTVLHAKGNCDGFKDNGITYPSGELQTRLLKEIYTECQVNPADISFVEAHGTGTKAGDPEELRTIDEVFLANRARALLIGSLKSNFGHAEAASGMASLVKVLIAFETGFIPPNLHYNKPRPESKALVEGRLQVVTTKKAFEDNNGLVGINNFGFGGSNCHLVVKHNTKTKDSVGRLKSDAPRIVCVSGRTEEAVNSLLDKIVETKDVEYMRLLQNVFRKNVRGHGYRGSVILDRHGEISRSSTQINIKKKPIYIALGELSNTKTLFKEMLDLPVFANTIQRIQEVFSIKKIDIKEMVNKNDNTSVINNSLASIFTQIAVLDVLKAIKLKPTGFFGNYSTPILGKTLCGYYDGTLALKETVDFVYYTLLTEAESNKKQLLNGNSEAMEEMFQATYNKLEQKNGVKYLQVNEYLNTTKTIKPKSVVVLRIGTMSREFTRALITKNIPTLNVSGSNDLLTAVGSIYEAGHDLNIHKLFPHVEFPVSRGTPMISPDIKWIHNRDWPVPSYAVYGSQGQKFKISLEDQEWSFAAGHIIDGRNLFPATGYLSLAWSTLALQKNLEMDNMCVVFENCKFIRASSFSKGASLDFVVSVQNETGIFEVLESGSLVVTGKIYATDQHDAQNYVLPLWGNDPNAERILTTKDVYKELRLRGYYYGGQFRAVQEYNLNTRVGKIKWNNNWVAFMDNMLQLQIIEEDTRLLYVPTHIRRMCIDSAYHHEFAKRYEDNILPVCVNHDSMMIKSGGIEIRGLNASAIPRKKWNAEPVLEEYTFVPNETTLNLANSLRVCTQLLMENSYGVVVSSVEIIDEAVMEASEPLSPLLHDVLFDIPLVKPDITILSEKKMEFENVQWEDSSLFVKIDCSLVIGTKLLQRKSVLNAALSSLKPNGFVLSREDLNVDLKCPDKNVTILTTHCVGNEKLVLLRRSKPKENHILIRTSSTDQAFSWLPPLQAAVKKDANTIVYAQNDPLNGIIGLVNCVRNEPGGANVKAFFILDEAPEFDPSHAFYANQIAKNMSINIFKNGTWGTYRHLLLEKVEERPVEHGYVNTLIRGDLSTMKWIEGGVKPNAKLDTDEELVHIYYTAINFRDVMTATGRLTVDVMTRDRRKQQCVQGNEFSGRTESGRRIMGICQCGSFSTLLVADKLTIWDVPENWTMEEAATVPIVYATCLQAFIKRAQMKPGESVLIHSGTGGVGQAAITLALKWGCPVYTTVGTQEKREYLLKRFPSLTDRNIGNSRDTSFETLVMKETNGRGVDVVLNSLSEDKLLASVRCLARGGRFLEIGKFDLGLDNPLNLLFMQKEAQFHGIMADSIFHGDIKIRILADQLMRDALKNGLLEPLPRIVFEEDEAEKAFRFMSTGKHMGKIVVKIRDEESNLLAIPSLKIRNAIPRYFCDSKAVYIICGGLGGFGLELADWLVLRGCRNLVLTSRTGITTGYQLLRTKVWVSYGCIVHISKENISTKHGVEALINEAKKLGPVAAVFNLAVVLQDAVIENQTVESFETSFKPKAYATQQLDVVTRERCTELKDFVVFSSVSCGRGNAGQTNYGMANSIMERICEKRRLDGYPALAVEWGAVGDVGLVAEMQESNRELVIGGTLQQRIINCLEVMDVFLTQQKATIVSSMVVAEKRLHSAGSDVVTAVASILGIFDLKSISFQATLAEVGMDSMSAVEIKQTLEREFDIFLSSQDIKNLTFFKLKEMQAEKEADQQIADKTNDSLSAEMFIRIKLLGDEALDNVPVLKLNSNHTQNAPKVFFMPGIEGTVTILNDLANNLEAEVIGLQYCYNKEIPSIEGLAASLLPLIEERTSPSEPLNLIAYSFGSVVAVEVMRLLEMKGYHGTLIIIDGSPKWFNHLADSMFSVNDQTEFEIKLLVYILSMEISSDIVLKHVDALYKCNNLDERIDLILKIAGDRLPRSVEKSKMFIYSISSRTKAGAFYKANCKLQSKVLLLKPTVSGIIMEEEDYGLSSICKDPVEVDVFEGNHITILENPDVSNKINEVLADNRRSQ